MPTDDGALVAGEPHGASTWYPANEHPRDKASYSFRISVPRGVEAIANGDPASASSAAAARSIWRWEAKEPMAAYLSTATIGQFEISTRTVGGRPYVDAIDPDLLERAEAAHRLALRRDRHRAARLPAAAAHDRRPRRRREALLPRHAATPQPGADFFFVEAHTRGRRRLDDAARRARPQLARRRRSTAPARCKAAPVPRALPARRAAATAGRGARPAAGRRRASPSAATSAGRSTSSRYAGRTRRGLAQLRDRRALPVRRDRRRRRRRHRRGAGSTSFEDDGDTLDGWTVAGRARRQPAQHRRLGLGHGRAGPAHAPATSPRRRSPASPR